MTPAAALLGGFVGAGLLLVGLGWRGAQPSSRPAAVPMAARVERFTLRVALAAGAGLGMLALTRWPVGALEMAVLGFVAPGMVGGASARKAGVARTEAVAAWAEMLRDTMAGAAGIEQAIIATASVSPPAIRDEVIELAVRLDRERLVAVLGDFADSLADPTADLVVAALILASEKQARHLGELLGTLSKSAREQATMRLRIEAGRARTRTSVRVVSATTLAFALGLVVLNRGYLAPFRSATGQGVLLVVGFFFGAGLYWLASMAKTGQPERFLASAASKSVAR
jgi:Flp pilus assembly protein TadB